MLRLMERITDLKNWEQEVFNPATLAEWRAQASEYVHLDPQTDQDVDMDLVTTRSWLWCVAELQDKARSLRETGHVVVFNADPSLYMLIYGQTKVLSRGGRVPLAADGLIWDSFPATGLGQTDSVQHHPPGEIRITSYINNLHPANAQAYSAIEKLISLAIRPWNDILVKGVRGRMPRRIHTYMVTNRELSPMGEVPPGGAAPAGWKENITRRSWTPEEWEEYCLRLMEFLQHPDENPKYRVFEPEPDDPPQT
ncbi:uncharacterized protein BP01DRAFT_384283 [Aspergillus saccharolyticus JOP 1030-1]|uniref:Uncharacterized protein n=1 Tax=Aspergillus saccharolyticus JOP 1030-1 TaxID=1450539 RepID=A0A318Z8P4_9EURO|nr:hypothetical protein BP01DRAFT_384283 [Aspergillus saccharolyticus JOP 1030-1]PYH43626.1 hypothetical protein BP01DRAFT_384283 [Aspergillus saccharolyticus JOP 1030-1]